MAQSASRRSDVALVRRHDAPIDGADSRHRGSADLAPRSLDLGIALARCAGARDVATLKTSPSPFKAPAGGVRGPLSAPKWVERSAMTTKKGRAPRAGIGALQRFERIAAMHEHKARVIREAIRLVQENRHNLTRGDVDEALGVLTSSSPAPGYGARHLERARRRASAELLAAFDTITPRDAPVGRERAVAPLIRHGYLKKKGDGYLRTSKAFAVDD